MKVRTINYSESFLSNSKSNSSLIKKLTAGMQCALLCVRDLANGDHLIDSTALTSAQTERKLVVIVGIDTDLLVILISQSSSEMCIREPMVKRSNI